MQVECDVMDQLLLLFSLSPSTARVRPNNSNYKVLCMWIFLDHYNAAILGAIASQITSLTIVFLTVHLDTDQRKHQSSASLAFVREFPAHMASNAENVSIWWRHHEYPWAVEVEFTQIWLKPKIWQFTSVYRTWWRHQMETFSALLAISAGPRKGQWRIESSLILYMLPANERRRYNVTSSLIAWVHSQMIPVEWKDRLDTTYCLSSPMAQILPKFLQYYFIDRKCCTEPTMMDNIFVNEMGRTKLSACGKQWLILAVPIIKMTAWYKASKNEINSKLHFSSLEKILNISDIQYSGLR